MAVLFADSFESGSINYSQWSFDIYPGATYNTYSTVGAANASAYFPYDGLAADDGAYYLRISAPYSLIYTTTLPATSFISFRFDVAKPAANANDFSFVRIYDGVLPNPPYIFIYTISGVIYIYTTDTGGHNTGVAMGSGWHTYEVDIDVRANRALLYRDNTLIYQTYTSLFTTSGHTYPQLALGVYSPAISSYNITGFDNVSVADRSQLSIRNTVDFGTSLSRTNALVTPNRPYTVGLQAVIAASVARIQPNKRWLTVISATSATTATIAVPLKIFSVILSTFTTKIVTIIPNRAVIFTVARSFPATVARAATLTRQIVFIQRSTPLAPYVANLSLIFSSVSNTASSIFPSRAKLVSFATTAASVSHVATANVRAVGFYIGYRLTPLLGFSMAYRRLLTAVATQAVRVINARVIALTDIVHASTSTATPSRQTVQNHTVYGRTARRILKAIGPLFH